jgi:hypothetical protein
LLLLSLRAHAHREKKKKKSKGQYEYQKRVVLDQFFPREREKSTTTRRTKSKKNP